MSRFQVYNLSGPREQASSWFRAWEAPMYMHIHGHDDMLIAWAERQPPGTYKVAVWNGHYLRFSEVDVPAPDPPKFSIHEWAP